MKAEFTRGMLTKLPALAKRFNMYPSTVKYVNRTPNQVNLQDFKQY